LENGFKPFEMQLSNAAAFACRIRLHCCRQAHIAVIDENDLACVVDAFHIVSIDDVPQATTEIAVSVSFACSKDKRGVLPAKPNELDSTSAVVTPPASAT